MLQLYIIKSDADNPGDDVVVFADRDVKGDSDNFQYDFSRLLADTDHSKLNLVEHVFPLLRRWGWDIIPVDYVEVHW